MSNFSSRRLRGVVIVLAGLIVSAMNPLQAETGAALAHLSEGDFVLDNFRFVSGETLPELRVHYTTMGKPHRNARGRIDNAVLLLHGTGAVGRSFLSDKFGAVLFGKGQLLDSNRYFVILPDAIGHGLSSKPSDGLHAKFPHYDYQDMVNAQYSLVTEGLQVDHLHLIIGASMGCMHAFLWGETHADFVDALMPMACLPGPVAGRSGVIRDLLVDAIRSDPDWAAGEYKTQPAAALKAAAGLLLIAAGAPLSMQASLPTGEAVSEFVEEYLARELKDLDANDLLYQYSASRNFDASAALPTITAPVTWINSADDFLDPPELGIAERESKRLKNGRFVLLPASEQTHGHGTYGYAALWQKQLAALLDIAP